MKYILFIKWYYELSIPELSAIDIAVNVKVLPSQEVTGRILFLYCFQGGTCCIWKFLGKGSNGSYSCGLHHSHGNTRSEPQLPPTLQPVAMWIRNSLSKARDETHMLMDTSWVLNSLSHKENCKSS